MRAELQVFLLGLSSGRKLRPASRELEKGISVVLVSVDQAEDFTFGFFVASIYTICP